MQVSGRQTPLTKWVEVNYIEGYSLEDWVAILTIIGMIIHDEQLKDQSGSDTLLLNN